MITGIVGLFSVVLSLLLFIFWVWMLIDCLTNRRLAGMEKLIWVLVIVFLNALGAAIYFFVGRTARI